MVFRDHRLSDLIGFSYSGMKATEAATDLVKHLEAIAEQLKTNAETTTLEKPWLVTIALDGENCWENYHQDGLPFLENLYQLLSDHQAIELVTVSEYLDRFPANAKIPVNKLHSGSWIDANFTTWIGDPAKNKAWEYLILAITPTRGKHCMQRKVPIGFGGLVMAIPPIMTQFLTNFSANT